MNIDGVERIAYRFSREEIAVLLKVLAIPELPELSISAGGVEEAVLQKFAEDEIMLVCGERTLVNGTISMILWSAANSKRCIRAKSALGTAVLYEGERLCVMAWEIEGGRLTFEPLQNLYAARAPFLERAEKLEEDMELTLRDGNSEVRMAGGMKDLDMLYAQL